MQRDTYSSPTNVTIVLHLLIAAILYIYIIQIQYITVSSISTHQLHTHNQYCTV